MTDRIHLISRIEYEVRAAGERQGWIAGRVLAAVSGGGDSMAMLTALRAVIGDRVGAAHIEHGLRGESSTSDAEFVREHCERSGIPFYMHRAFLKQSSRKGESPEMAGRRARYEFLAETAREHGYDRIATGHTADDSVETAIFNFFRGTGVRGLVGISEMRGIVVRPMIRTSREDLRDYLRAMGISWREDETNTDPFSTRNRIRCELLPWVRENINASADRAILGLARECEERAAEDRSIGRGACARIRIDAHDHLAAWDIVRARRASKRELAEAIREEGRSLGLPVLDRSRTEELIALISRSGRWTFQWAGDVELRAADDKIVWQARRREDRP